MPTESFYIKQSDTAPTISTTLTDGDDNAIDLTDASVRFHIAEPRGGRTIVDEQATIANETEGQVRYTWDDADTSHAGRYRAEFEVTYDNDDVETFPNVGYETIVIDQNLA